MTDLIILQAGFDTNFWLPLIAMLAVVYFFMIRPQTKKQNKQQDFLNNLKKGDEVATSSGILGKINKIEDKIITIEVGTKQFLRVTAGAVSLEMTESVFTSTEKSEKPEGK